MPVLDPSYIGTWYYFIDSVTGETRIFESWRERQVQELARKQLLQGDIGTHVMNAGGIKWETDVKSPVLVFEDAIGDQGVSSVFAMIKDQFDIIRDPVEQAQAQFLMKSAVIHIAEEGVDCDVTFVATNPQIFVPTFGLPTEMDFVARVARFYDTRFLVTENIGVDYAIIDGEISIEVDIEDNYFVGAGQYPYFSVQGYQVKGTLKVLAVPNDDYLVIAPQNPGDFTVHGYSNTALSIGGEAIGFGEANLNSFVEKSLTPTGISSINIGFECYVRYTTDIETAGTNP